MSAATVVMAAPQMGIQSGDHVIGDGTRKALAWWGTACDCDYCGVTLLGAPGAVAVERDGTAYHMSCWRSRKAKR